MFNKYYFYIAGVFAVLLAVVASLSVNNSNKRITFPEQTTNSYTTQQSQEKFDSNTSQTSALESNRNKTLRKQRSEYKYSHNKQLKLAALMSLIKQTAALDANAVDKLADAEARLVQQLNNSPMLVNDLLDTYGELPSSGEKNLLRSMLASTESLDVESYAMEHIMSGDEAKTGEWLALLRDLGVRSPESRYDLLAELPLLEDGEHLSTALQAITPTVVSVEERANVLDKIETYLDHSDDKVRSAALETLSKWGDNQHAPIIAHALQDSSIEVRKTAAFAAFASTIHSEDIKTSLLTIMNDVNEDWELRTEAHSALAGYSLPEQDYEDFYKFHLKLQVLNSGEAKG